MLIRRPPGFASYLAQTRWTGKLNVEGNGPIIIHTRRKTMSNPAIDKAKGQIKEAAGKVTGNQQLETEGQVEQVSAAVREKAADIKAGVAEAVGNVIERFGTVASDLKDKVTGKG
jgi:uncharacterized protein YjbJ (UPF0337 family)